MKKLMAILLVILMLVSVFASCGGNDETTTTEAPTTEIPTTEAPTTEAPTTEAPTTEAPTTEAPTTEATTTEAPTTIDPNAPWSSKNDVRDTWSGKTLNVACSTWYATGAPWAVMEVFINEESDANFGAEIQEAVLDRNKFVKNTYGVKVSWINATKASMHKVLEAATLSKNINYDLAMPRAMNAQELVAGGYLYDMAGREFLDFRNSYYNDLSVETYTAYGHTFFVAGDFSNLDKELSAVLYFNKALLGDGSASTTNELYQMVREGKWTYDKLVSYASAAYSDDGGDGEDYGTDTYGMNGYSFDKYYRYFGVNRAIINENTGMWELGLNDDRVDDIISAIITTDTANWCFSAWGGCWGETALTKFQDNRLLFYNEVVQHTYVCEYGDIGIVPFPMLNEEQGRYYVPTSSQMSVLMCIPKLTLDRAMSEYMLDVLAWTGNEYTMRAYLDMKAAAFDSEVEMEMLTEYILPNISYDPGEAVGWGTLINLTESYANNTNNFEQFYAEKAPDALKTIAEWNAAWGGYTEE